MHELSIALSIVDIAAAAVEKHGGGKVSALYLKLGALSGVVKDALLFSWELASADTLLEGSRLIIEEVPLAARCTVCEADVKLKSISSLKCPVCGTPTPTILHGKELEVTSLEIE